MGAYGSPEHLPGDNQKPRYQYGYVKSRRTGIIHGDLNPWEKVLLIIYLCAVGLFTLIMVLSLTTNPGSLAVKIISVIAFFALACLFSIRINAHKMAWPFIVCSIVAFFVYFSAVGSSETLQSSAVPTGNPAVSITSSEMYSESIPQNQTDKEVPSSDTTNAQSKVQSQETITDTEARYKKSCGAFAYKDIARNPNNYEGQQAKFTGQVIQVEESWGSDILRIDVTKDEYGVWNDTIYVDYTPKSKNESRVLENDVVTVYGKLDGIKTYTTIFGSDVSIPYLKAQYIDISPESK